jgi:hypothetical protein
MGKEENVISELSSDEINIAPYGMVSLVWLKTILQSAETLNMDSVPGYHPLLRLRSRHNRPRQYIEQWVLIKRQLWYLEQEPFCITGQMTWAQ